MTDLERESRKNGHTHIYESREYPIKNSRLGNVPVRKILEYIPGWVQLIPTSVE